MLFFSLILKNQSTFFEMCDKKFSALFECWNRSVEQKNTVTPKMRGHFFDFNLPLISHKRKYQSIFLSFWDLACRCTRLLNTSLPRDESDTVDIMQPDQLADMLTKKREQHRKIVLGHDISVLSCGYIDTAKGAVLTCDAGLKAAESHAENKRHRRSVAAIANERRVLNKEKDVLSR